MTLAAMKTALIDELFEAGRAWTGDIAGASDDVLAYSLPVSADDLADFSLFTTQVTREFDAVSGDLLEAGAALGAPVAYVREAAGEMLISRYTGGVSFTDWRLWFDRPLRGELVNKFGASFLSGKDALFTADDMIDILANQPEKGIPSIELPSIKLPTAQAVDAAKVTSVASNIGSFGPVGFEVSSREIFTLNELSRKREAGFAEHKVVNGKSRLQFTGIGLWEVSIRITLSRNWTDPEKRIEQLSEVHASGEHHPLVIGGRNFGRFVLVSYSEDVKSFGRSGEIETAGLSLSLKEYSEEGSGVVQVSRVRTAAPAPIKQAAPPRKLAVSNFRGR